MNEMPSILKKITDKKRERIAATKKTASMANLIYAAEKSPPTKPFAAALSKQKSINIIAEMKHKSPSKGVIREPFDPIEIMEAYTAGGADAFSILTEEDFFGGSLEYLRRVRAKTDKPILMKDFVIDEYQLFEGRAAGADAVLLIAAIHSRAALRFLNATAEGLGLATFVEVHTIQELDDALDIGAKIIGINNRDLHTFEVDIQTTCSIIAEIPPQRLVVSESGICGQNDIRTLRAAGVDAFLIGEYFMKSADIAAAVRELKGCI